MTWGRAKKTEPYVPFLASDAISRAAWDTPQSVLNFQIGTFFEGYLKTPTPDGVLSVPLLQVLLPPGGTIDFADPVTGLPGLGSCPYPDPDRVLCVWADDLLTVSHGEHWKFIVDSDGPIDRAWLDTAFPPARSDRDFTPAGAIVEVVFTMPMEPPFTEIRVGDRDPSRPIAYVSMEDLRPVRSVERS